MKKAIILISLFIAFLIVISEIEEITFTVILLKSISLFYIWLVAKANNYFYEGE